MISWERNWASWLKKTFEPELFTGMHDKGWDLVPYVNVEEHDPSKGFTQFYDSARDIRQVMRLYLIQ